MELLQLLSIDSAFSESGLARRDDRGLSRCAGLGSSSCSFAMQLHVPLYKARCVPFSIACGAAPANILFFMARFTIYHGFVFVQIFEWRPDHSMKIARWSTNIQLLQSEVCFGATGWTWTSEKHVGAPKKRLPVTHSCKMVDIHLQNCSTIGFWIERRRFIPSKLWRLTEKWLEILRHQISPSGSLQRLEKYLPDSKFWGKFLLDRYTLNNCFFMFLSIILWNVSRFILKKYLLNQKIKY